MSPRASLRGAPTVIASLALMLGLFGATAAHVAAAAAPSPGCAAWQAYGAAGTSTEYLHVDGPFFKGEVLKVTIDASTQVGVRSQLRYGTTEAETLDLGATRGPITFLVPKAVSFIELVGHVDEIGYNLVLKHFTCTPLAVGPGAAVEIEKLVAAPPVGPLGDHFTTIAGTAVEYHITVRNMGEVDLSGVTLTDDHADLVAKGCVAPTTLAVAATFACSYGDTAAVGTTVNQATVDTTETAPVHATATLVGLLPAQRLQLAKTSPLQITFPVAFPARAGLHTATEGDRLLFGLAYPLVGDPVPNVRLTDVVPVGYTFVPGSATNGNYDLDFVGYDNATRTLTWAGTTVYAGSEVTYEVTVDHGASQLDGPLRNQASIVSDETDRVDATFDMTIVAPGSEPTGPPTDVAAPPTSEAGIIAEAPGAVLLLIAGLFAGALVVLRTLTVPIRERRR
jgi:hypothetical protein